MKLFAALRGRGRAVASISTLAVVATGLTTVAVLYKGVDTTQLHLNDGGVWVTNQSQLLLGHLNAQAHTLDGALTSSGSPFDVLQEGDTVLLLDDGAHTLTPVDPAAVALGQSVAMPEHAVTALGGGTLAVLDTDKGSLWVLPVAQVATFNPAAAPTAKLGKGAAVAVGADGVVHAVSPARRERVDIALGEDAVAAKPITTQLPLGASDQVSITAVGARAVVLDATAGKLFLPGDKQSVSMTDADTAVLQQPGPASASVLLETGDALVAQPLDGGAVRRTPAGGTGPGTVAAPVYVAGCAYAVWSGSGQYVRDCAQKSADLTMTLPGITAGAQLRFRVNRGVVVLNDTATGGVWLASDAATRIDNWDEVKPATDDQKSSNRSTADDQGVSTSGDQKRSNVNHPPVVADDVLGVRAGRTTLLPVLANDSDPDGDVLTVSVADPKTAIGQLQLVDGGQQLEITVPADATGTATFGYTADDGRGGTAKATVRVSVHPPTQNGAPTQPLIPTTIVDQGADASFDVLPDFIDPDGDAVFLKDASASTGDGVRFTADGQVTFSAVGGSTGVKKVAVIVSDGVKDTVGEMRFDVRAKGSAKPIANADFATAHVGQTITVDPLANDESPSGATLQLAKVDETTGAQLAADSSAGTFTFSAAAPGSYLAGYTVSDGPNSAVGWARIDVTAGEASHDPIAVPDTALLPVGGSTLVDVLANDQDPDGGVLVVQSVSVPPTAGIAVDIVDHRLLRITDQPGITGQVSVDYTVSNGTGSATSQALVVSVPAPARTLPPVAEPDTAKVRAGDVVTIPVLANDFSPSGSQLTIAQKLVAPVPGADTGLIFVSQNTLRFQASDKAGTVHATYQAVDASGQATAGYVTIQVIPADAASNSAPVPLPIVARTIAGTTVRIPVTLDGIDPDGDSVSLIGIGSPATLGTAALDKTGVAIDYTAPADARGTDSFTYTVRDRLGATATGTVQVGVAPPAAQNQRPYALADHLSVRPERRVTIDVLANDSDPDGDVLTLQKKLSIDKGMTAEVADGKVTATAPAKAGVYNIQYTVSDGHGGTAIGVATVTVDPKAPLQPPVANDDVVSLDAIIGKKTVDVAVLDNDADPDGTASDLKVSLPKGGGRIAASGGVVTVTVQAEPQTIPYVDTDPDGGTGTAFIVVPGTEQLLPHLKKGVAPVRAKAGEKTIIDVSKYVDAAQGGAVAVTDAASVRAAHGTTRLQGRTQIVYTAQATYSGADQLSFDVADAGGGAAAPHATLSIPVVVTGGKAARPSSGPTSTPAARNAPPTFAGGSLQVAPGEAASTLDLRAASSDQDPGELAKLDFKVSTGGLPAGVTATLRGHIVSVTAAVSAAKGETGTIGVSVSDGVNPPVSGTVTVTVISSTRPLPTTTDDVVPKASAGQPVVVSPLDNDFDPFPGTPLHLISAAVTSGDGQVSFDAGSGKVTITPAASFSGNLVVTYRVGDATDDSLRQADGHITVTVQGKPDAPGTPSVTDVEDGTVVLSWTAGSDHGSPITGYTVSAAGFSQDCPSTTCTLTGLTNNTTYDFTVVAHNGEGDSPASASSADARPDVKPSQMGKPTVTASTTTDGELDVSWPAAVVPHGGSSVTQYLVTISPAPPLGTATKTVPAPATSTSLTGLANGTSYSVTLTASNQAGDSDPSAATVATPAGKPAAPTVTRSDFSNGNTVTFQWGCPSTNSGRAVTCHYSITGTVSGSGTGTSWQKTDAGYNQTYHLSVYSEDADGRVSSTAIADIGTGAPPAPSASLSKGGAHTTLTCKTSPCQYLQVSLNGGQPGHTYTVRILDNCGYVRSDCRAGSTAWLDGFIYHLQPGQSDTTSQTYGYPGSTLTAYVFDSDSGDDNPGNAIASSTGLTW